MRRFCTQRKIKVDKIDSEGVACDPYSGKIDYLQQRLSVLDYKGEEEVFSEVEIADMHGITSYIHSLSRINTSICWQQ